MLKLWAAVLGAAVAQGGAIPFPQVEKLPSGLEVAWLESATLPLVDLMWIVPSGHRDDPSGKSGVSEVLASLLDQSTAVEALGASLYSSVDEDYLTVGVHGISSDAPELLKGLVATLKDSSLSSETFSRERSRVLEKLKHLQDFPDSLVGLAHQRRLLAGTPYGRGGVFSQKEVQALTEADVRAYQARHFRPDRGLLLVVGRFDRAQLRASLGAELDAWKAAEAPLAAAPTTAHPQSGVLWSHPALRDLGPQDIWILDRPELSQAQLRLGWASTPLRTEGRAALEVGNAMLGESFGSLLNSKLRDELQLTYGVGSSFTYYRDHSVFTVHSATRPDLMGRLLQETLTVLDGLQRKGARPEDVESARAYLEGNFPLQTSTLSAVASRWVGAYLFGLGTNALNDYFGAIHRVPVPEVNAALKKLLDPTRRRIVIAGDAGKLALVLRASGFNRVRVVRLGDLL